MASRKPTVPSPHLQPSPGRAGAAAAYVLWWLSDRIDFTGDCWLWTGAKAGRGYGAIDLCNYSFPERIALTHRLVYSICVAPIPDGMRVLHHCDTPACCRPAHLFLGTNADNIADKVSKGRQASGQAVRRNHAHLKGEVVKTARLTAQQVMDIRRAEAGGESQKAIAARFGVSDAQVSSVVHGKSWRHLPVLRNNAGKYKRICPGCGHPVDTRLGRYEAHRQACLVLGKE